MTLRACRFILLVAAAPALAGVLLFAGPGGSTRDQPGVFIRHPETDTVPGELTVRFRDGSSAGERQAALAAAGVSLSRELPALDVLGDYAVVSVPPGQLVEAGAALAAARAVQSVEEQVIRQPYFAPNDEYYQQAQWNLRLIQAEQAWDVSRGADVTVAVLDTGVAYEDYTDPATSTAYGEAPDLTGTQFVQGLDAFGEDLHPGDDNGHGTHVAGTVAQTTNNSTGVAGVAFEAKIMPVKVCGPLTYSPYYGCPPLAIAEGVLYAVNNGAEVINLSLGGPGQVSQEERQALEYAKAANVVVVAAAGNRFPNKGGPVLDYPAAVESVIGVGAAGTTGVRAKYSNYGLGEGGKIVDLVAPGGDYDEQSGILQNTYSFACPDGGQKDFTKFWYCYDIGTSMAAAHVSGAVAIIRSAYPQLSASQVRIVLRCSALDVGIPGDDLEHGDGLLQVYTALLDDDQDGTPNCVDTTFDTPNPTPTPSPTPAPDCAVPLPTPTSTPTDTPPPTPAETPTPEPTPSPTPVATETATPDETPVPEPTPAPTDTPPAPVLDDPTPVDTATPTATPPPGPLACGDVDCDYDLDSVDALHILRYVAVIGNAACMGSANVDCDGELDAVDALMVLRRVAGLPVTQVPGCPPIGYG